MINKKVITIDVILIVGSLLIIAGLVGYSRPLVIAPVDDYTTTDNSILFEFNKAKKILIDDNLEFTSPEEIYVEDGIVVNLKPGEYYWKIVNVLGESEVRQLTIKSEIDLRLKEFEDGYKVVNFGNERLKVDIYKGGILTGKVSLNPRDSQEVVNSEGNKFIGGKNE